MSEFNKQSFEDFVNEYYSFAKDSGKKYLNKNIKKIGFQRALSKFLNPVTDWSRFSEFFLSYEILKNNLTDGDKILDIGSPKLFSIWLATKKQLTIHATDIWDQAVMEYSNFWDKNIKNSSVKFEQADLLNLHYPDNEFDGIFSISTIEHAYDPDWKRTISKNLSRILKPGKIALITTPFGSKSIIQYKDHTEYSKSLDKNQENFFMRIINQNDVNEFEKIAHEYGLILEKSFTINTFVNKKGLIVRQLPVYLNVLLGFLKPKFAMQYFEVKSGLHFANNENYEERWTPDLVHSDIVLVFRKLI